MLRFLSTLAVGFVVSITGAVASEIPDLKGTWMVRYKGAQRVKAVGLAPHDVVHVSPNKTGIVEGDLTVTIDKQERMYLLRNQRQ